MNTALNPPLTSALNHAMTSAHPAPVALHQRRHVDLSRTASAACR